MLYVSLAIVWCSAKVMSDPRLQNYLASTQNDDISLPAYSTMDRGEQVDFRPALEGFLQSLREKAIADPKTHTWGQVNTSVIMLFLCG